MRRTCTIKPPTFVSSTSEPSAAPSSRARNSTDKVVLSPANSVCARGGDGAGVRLRSRRKMIALRVRRAQCALLWRSSKHRKAHDLLVEEGGLERGAVRGAAVDDQFARCCRVSHHELLHGWQAHVPPLEVEQRRRDGHVRRRRLLHQGMRRAQHAARERGPRRSAQMHTSGCCDEHRAQDRRSLLPQRARKPRMWCAYRSKAGETTERAVRAREIWRGAAASLQHRQHGAAQHGQQETGARDQLQGPSARQRPPAGLRTGSHACHPHRTSECLQTLNPRATPATDSSSI
jgi:hypothetical protein